MKKCVLIHFLLSLSTVFAQISLNRSDFAHPGDTYKLNVLGQTLGINYNQTGQNFVWNYSNLNSLIVRNDTFYSPWQTPPVYWLFFNGFNTTMAQKMPNPPFSVSPFLSISDVYNFYYVNNARYELTGFGALINNIPTPIKHDTADIIYRFPLNYGNKDTSFSTFDVNIPGIGYWKNNQRRYNHVDGWGTLIIPNDTFQVLRIKSQIFNSDSVRLDTLGGFSGRFPRPKQTEYKFLTQNGGIPVLQILTQTNQIGMENVVSVEYLKIDSPTHKLSPHLNSNSLIIYPQPAHSTVWIKSTEPFAFYYHLQLYDMNGNLIFQDKLHSQATYELKNIPTGLYTIIIFNDKNIYTQKIWITN